MATRAEKVPTESYKGVRDFYPADMAVLTYLFDGMRRACEKFGYAEIGASPLESAELYRGKTSEEIVNEQTYTFTDRGDREVTLRPEMTPTVARMIAARRRELAFPVRWYSIPNIFRYERPQRGRLREHWQLNADLFGVNGIEAEVEIIALARAVLTEFGAEEEMFSIKVNDRAALEGTFDRYKLSPEQRKALRQLIDKKDKIKDFEAAAVAIVGGPFEFDSHAPASVENLVSRLRALGVVNVEFDPTLVRGFDYYTGVVFEVYDTAPENQRSLFGGGRYDNLLEMFGAEPIPAVGFGMGDVTLRDFLETHNLLPPHSSKTQLALCVTDEALLPDAEVLASRLRTKGVRVAVAPSGKKVGDQVKWADRTGIPFVVVLGEEEVKSGQYKLKKLETGEEKTLAEDDISANFR